MLTLNFEDTVPQELNDRFTITPELNTFNNKTPSQKLTNLLPVSRNYSKSTIVLDTARKLVDAGTHEIITAQSQGVDILIDENGNVAEFILVKKGEPS